MDVSSGVRWRHLSTVLNREGPFCGKDFEVDSEGDRASFNDIQDCRVLVIGAGGLGSDILKCLALSGFHHIDVIDMDTIDPSNLNRQFLFRAKDMDRPKSEVAADFINRRVKGAKVTAHFGKIQDKSADFYEQFHLDNVAARRWINAFLHSMLSYDITEDEDGNEVCEVDYDSVIGLIDGGTEGLKGNIRVVMPGRSSCIDCFMELFPPEVKVPLCTIAATPRNLNHCVQYAGLIAWTSESPFSDASGTRASFDADDPRHVRWVTDKANERAKAFKIGGTVDRKKALGVMKNIIPAIASTNALISGLLANEAFKYVTDACPLLDNYLLFNGEEGSYGMVQSFSPNPSCDVCSQRSERELAVSPSLPLKKVLDTLLASPQFPLQNPRLQAGERLIYVRGGPRQMREMCEANLAKPVGELLGDGDVLTVSDAALSNSLINFVLKFEDEE